MLSTYNDSNKFTAAVSIVFVNCMCKIREICISGDHFRKDIEDGLNCGDFTDAVGPEQRWRHAVKKVAEPLHGAM